MKGTIRKRGSTWTWQFALERTGKRRTQSKGGYRTKRDAQAGLTEALAQHQRGESRIEPSRETLRRFMLDEWLPIVDATRKPATARGYRWQAEHHVLPELGDLELRDVTPGHVVSLYTRLRAAGRLDHKGGLSESALRQVHAVLRGSLEYAVERGLLMRNPAAAIPRDTRPKVRRQEAAAWSVEQLRSFLSVARGDRLEAPFTLAAMTGMRRGELLGLRWDDIDVSALKIAVRRARVATAYDVNEGAPKNGRARTISIDAATTAMLRRWRTRQLEERLAWGEAWSDTGYVVTREDGTPMHPHALSAAFDRLVKRSGLPALTLHGLRHTHATALLRQGVHPRVVQERLGHSTVAITLDLYSHVAPDLQVQAAADLGRLVLGDSR